MIQHIVPHSCPEKMMRSAIDHYGVDGRAYQYDDTIRGVVVYMIKYDGRYPVGFSKIATWFGEDRRPPLAQLEFNFA